jgi:hypothetical protein
MKKQEQKTIKKLKLNKQTISILKDKMKDQVKGGGWGGQGDKSSQYGISGC